jgi:DNA-binding CsgD family transcriptional regulator
MDVVSEPSGTLVFDLKCRLLCSNHKGRVLYIGESTNGPRQPSPDIAFDIKRLCFRLKKLADSIGTDGAAFDRLNGPPIVVTSNDQHYRLEGSLLADEVTHRTCLLVKVTPEESKKPGKPNFAHYRSQYGLTLRELQILELLSKGASYKEISYSLSISFHTVRDHVKHIRFKLHTDGKFGILARLIEEGSVCEEELNTGSGELDEPAALAGPESDLSSAIPVEPIGRIPGKIRPSAPTREAAPSDGQRGSAITYASLGTPPRTRAARITASSRAATKRDMHRKGKA